MPARFPAVLPLQIDRLLQAVAPLRASSASVCTDPAVEDDGGLSPTIHEALLRLRVVCREEEALCRGLEPPSCDECVKVLVARQAALVRLGDVDV